VITDQVAPKKSMKRIDIQWTEANYCKYSGVLSHPLEVEHVGGIYWIFWPKLKQLKVGMASTSLHNRVLQHLYDHGNFAYVRYMAIHGKPQTLSAESSLKKAIERYRLKGLEWAKVATIERAEKLMSGLSYDPPCDPNSKILEQEAILTMRCIEQAAEIQYLKKHKDVSNSISQAEEIQKLKRQIELKDSTHKLLLQQIEAYKGTS
jgi:hypothetical protein